MTTKIKKWGNSLAIRIPKEAILKSSFHEGESVVVTNTKDGVLISLAKTASLEDMVSKIQVNNLHNETDWGDKAGNEVW